jgi:hypothetical protein
MGLFKGHNTVTRADKISNFTVATAEYGAPVMEILGTTRISGNVIYYDDFEAHEHRETQRTGKGGKSTSTNITYTYTVAAILGLCEGPISTVRRIWVNKEIYTYPSAQVPLTLFYGTQNQQPWSYVVGRHPERALAYEGLAYMAGVIDLGSNASMPSYNFEVCGKLLEYNDGTDVNPMAYIKYVLSKVGQGNVTINGESNFRSYCANAGLYISTPSEATGTEEVQKIVNDIANLCGAYVFWSNDAYKIVPLADRPVGEWQPDKTIRYDLTPDDFIPQSGSCITWSRKDSSEQYNRWTVEFQNRANNYEKESVTYEDVDDIAERGVMQAPTIQARYIYTKERAVVVAEAAARRGKVEKNQYKFRLGWAFCRLEPGDLVRITDEASGISNTVVMITGIDEDASGFLSVTAVSWFQDDYGAAEYDVHEVDRPDFDFNAPPGDTAVPAIFQPPADLTANGLELWLAAKGLSENWGGCTVYVSDDNEHYRTVGQITNNARFGPLVSSISASATSMEVDIDGQLLSGTSQDAQRANTLLWVNGECMSYTTATLLQNGHYRLDGLIRGQYNTTAAEHADGSTVVRCDEALLRAPFDKEDIGKTLYLKFCSYNIFGAAESLAEVQAYQYTLQPYYIPPVTGLAVRNRYRQLKDGVSRYDIVVDWTPPDLQSYLEGQVWYKTDHGQTEGIPAVSGVPVNQLGFQGDWIFGGSGKNQVVIPQAIVGDTYLIAVTTKDEWGVATAPDFAPRTTITVALKTETPNTPDDFGISYGTEITVSWKEVTNSDILFYEVRRDTAVGVESANLLARTSGTKTIITLTQRSGTLYLYAKSPSGKYSTPATLLYSKEQPPKPDKPVVSANLGSINIMAGAIPAGCSGMTVYVNGNDGIVTAHTENNTYTHSVEAGIYDVSVAYTDYFGEGTRSTEARIVIKKTIDAQLLEDEAINIAKVDDTIKAALADAVASAQDLITVHGDINTVNSRIADVQAQGEGLRNELVETNKSVARTITQVEENTANISQVYQDIDSIQTTIENFHIEGDVGDTVEYLQSQITQNATDINQTVSKLNSSPSASGQYFAISQLQQTADGLTSTVAQKADKSTETSHYNTLTSSINQQADRITSVVAELNDTSGASSYSAIAQLQDNIELKVSKYSPDGADDLVSQINLAPSTARIRGKLITLDGDTKVTGYFWANAVEAKSIDVGKINANSLSALSANIGNVTGGTITGTTVSGSTIIGSTIRNANNTFSVSANGAITGATITAGTIEASMITNAGFQVKASVIGGGTVSGNNGVIPLPSGYTEAQCLWTAYQPQFPDAHPNLGNFYRDGYQFYIVGRTVVAVGWYRENEASLPIAYYPNVTYRIIGIK